MEKVSNYMKILLYFIMCGVTLVGCKPDSAKGNIDKTGINKQDTATLNKNYYYDIRWDQDITEPIYKKYRTEFEKKFGTFGSFLIHKGSFNKIFFDNITGKSTVKNNYLRIYLVNQNILDSGLPKELGLLFRLSDKKYLNSINENNYVDDIFYFLKNGELVQLKNGPTKSITDIKRDLIQNYQSLIPNSYDLFYKTSCVKYKTDNLKLEQKAISDIQIDLIFFTSLDGNPTGIDYIDANDYKISVCTIYNDGTINDTGRSVVKFYDAGQLEP